MLYITLFLFILAITGLVNPIPYNPSLNFDMYVLLGSTLLLIIFMFTLRKRKLDRWEAVIFLIGYFAYTWYLVSID